VSLYVFRAPLHSSKTLAFPRGFQSLVEFEFYFYFKDSKLDVDLGYIANDRSEFADSDVAGLHMKLNF
jgi:iron complex outermembrane receptor protein